MKKLIAASIALVSVAANAQLMPISGGFLARVAAPEAIAAVTSVAKPVNAAINLLPPVRQNSLNAIAVAATGNVTAHFTVDTNGVPQNITLDRSISPSADAKIIEAVSALRYTPGSLHGEKVAYPVALTLTLK